MKTSRPLVFAATGLLALTSRTHLFAQSVDDWSAGKTQVTLQSPPEDAGLASAVADAPAPHHQVPPGLMGGTPHSYNVQAWGGLLTPTDGMIIATTSNILDKARDGWRSTATSPGGVRAISASLVFDLAPTTDDLPALTSWIPAGGTIRNGLKQQMLPMAWDFAERHPVGFSASGFGPSLYWMEKAMAAIPTAKMGREWSTGAMALRAGALEITSADRPRHRNANASDFSDYLKVWAKRAANVMVAEGLSALMTEKPVAIAPSLNENTPAHAERLVATRSRPSFPFVVSYAY